MHVLLKFQENFLMKVKSVSKQPIQSPHYRVQTFRLTDRNPTMKIFDIQKN